MGNSENNGFNKLAGVLQKRTKALIPSNSLIDVGEIQADLSLLCNKFPLPIPQSDYLVCRSVLLGKVDDILYRTQEIEKDNSGYHTHDLGGGGHAHTVSTSCSGCSAPQALTGSTGSSDGHSHSVSLSCGGCSTPVSLSGNTTTDGEHGHVEKDNNIMKHVHDVLIGEKMRQLQAGDRVLVVWIDSADPCVVDLIFPATALERDANSYEMITG